MTNTLEHFRKKLEQQKEDSSNRLSQLEACLKATLDDFEQYIHQGIPVYTQKEETGILTPLEYDVVTTLSFGCFLVATFHNVITTLSQCCVLDVVTTTKN